MRAEVRFQHRLGDSANLIIPKWELTEFDFGQSRLYDKPSFTIRAYMTDPVTGYPVMDVEHDPSTSHRVTAMQIDTIIMGNVLYATGVVDSAYGYTKKERKALEFEECTSCVDRGYPPHMFGPYVGPGITKVIGKYVEIRINYNPVKA